MAAITPNSLGTFVDSEGNAFTVQNFPLRIIMLSYMSPHDDILERRIEVLFNDGLFISINHDGVLGLMDSETLIPYQDTIGNIVLNEQDYWFADKDPFLTSKLLI